MIENLFLFTVFNSFKCSQINDCSHLPIDYGPCLFSKPVFKTTTSWNLACHPIWYLYLQSISFLVSASVKRPEGKFITTSALKLLPCTFDFEFSFPKAYKIDYRHASNSCGKWYRFSTEIIWCRPKACCGSNDGLVVSEINANY